MIKLSKYPTREKDDVIEWKSMPTGRCDMNFRADDSATLDGSFTTTFVVRSAIIAWTMIVVAYFFHGFLIAIESAEVSMLGVAILTLPLFIGLRIRHFRASTRVYFAALQILAISTTPSFLEPQFQFALISAWLGLSIFPAIFGCCDKLVLHYVHWATAHPNLDLKTMKGLRKLWDARFSRCRTSSHLTFENTRQKQGMDALVSATNNYRFWRWLMMSVAATVVLVASIFVQFNSYLTLLTLASAVIAAAVAIEFRFAGTAKLLLKTLKHFVEYKGIRGNPRWIFLTPTGPAKRRRSDVFVCLVLISGYVACSFTTGETNWQALIQGGLLTLILTMFFKLFVVTVLAPVMLFGIFMVVSGPLLWCWNQACETETAWLRRKDWSPYDSYVDRIRNSSNPNERNSIWMGHHLELGFPILVDTTLVKEHMHLYGATGSGKTALGLATTINQLIKRGDGPVIVLDCKGDRALLHSCRTWAETEGKKFKWFTTSTGKSTYLFNPLAQKNLESMTMTEVVDFFMQAFNLHHGSGYGRAWFSAVASAAFRASLKELGRLPRTLGELMKQIEILVSQENSNFKDAKHLMFMMQAMSEFEQLTLGSSARASNAAQHAIHLAEAIEEKQVIYFNLQSLAGSTAGEISRLATFSAVAASQEYKERTGESPNVYLVIDEAQEVVAKNISKVLAQARGWGLTCILAHQALSQLKTSDVDLTQEVIESTCVQLCFSARDAETKKHLAAASGEVPYYSSTWKQYAERVEEGDIGPHRALGFDGEPAIVEVSEERGPRLTDTEIQEMSRNLNQCVITVGKYKGLSRFRGAFPIHMDFPISRETYLKRDSKTPWPVAASETIETGSAWPTGIEDETTVVARPPSPDTGLSGDQLTPEFLDEIARRALGENDDDENWPEDSDS